MWILFVWLAGTYSVSMSDAVQPTLTSMNQEFNTESACRAAFVKIKEVNNGELMLRGVFTPKGANQ
ncbi:hypothetical protein SB00001_03841 [Klebsiella variicola]|uniref:hypothetical protein n=1 Tax=Klebsiella variicola TaxID=244366 RepID=UPI00109D2D14|nr:hypothetical protein [Klebsiella variicola]UDC22503.1 hypothetical protein LGN95_19990 [Klebsiella variicola subsp. variicola]VGP35175.1 hypothetical protein SB00001_03841 [Klebsiella variicola]